MCPPLQVHDDSLVEPIEMRMIRPARLAVRYADASSSPEMAGMKKSIREHGLLQPIIVRPLERGFEIVAGHRRFAACRSLRWRFVPCRIREFTDRQAYEIQLAENLQRKTMDPIEEAEAYQRYVLDFGWGGVKDLADRIGKSQEYVSHRMQLLKLPEVVREKVAASALGVSQALEIAGADPQTQERLLGGGRMTVRQIREAKVCMSPPSVCEERIVRKSGLALKIALSRIDELVHDARREGPRKNAQLVEFLMGQRRAIHSMIDDAVKYKMSAARKG